MTSFPLALALEDFVPVVLTTAGIVLLRKSPWAALVVGAGGFAKATWKLIVALDGPDLGWLESCLFPLLAIGFTLLLAALYEGRARLFFAVALVAALAGSAAVRDTWPAMVWTILAVTLVAAHLVRLAWLGGDRVAAGLFATWLAGQYVLGPLATKAEQSVALQWVEQSFNTAAQAAFAYAAWRLYSYARAKEAVTA